MKTPLARARAPPKPVLQEADSFKADNQKENVMKTITGIKAGPPPFIDEAG